MFVHRRWFKGIVHPKLKILSSFTHPVVPNLYECICSVEHKGRYSEECGKQSSSGAPLTSIVFVCPTMVVNCAQKQSGYKLSSKDLPLCSAEQRHSYRFGTTGRVNDDSIFLFVWTTAWYYNFNRSLMVRSIVITYPIYCDNMPATKSNHSINYFRGNNGGKSNI